MLMDGCLHGRETWNGRPILAREAVSGWHLQERCAFGVDGLLEPGAGRSRGNVLSSVWTGWGRIILGSHVNLLSGWLGQARGVLIALPWRRFAV
jgi:hypothetical protein